jgi:hypothetical protein
MKKRSDKLKKRVDSDEEEKEEVGFIDYMRMSVVLIDVMYIGRPKIQSRHS